MIRHLQKEIIVNEVLNRVLILERLTRQAYDAAEAAPIDTPAIFILFRLFVVEITVQIVALLNFKFFDDFHMKVLTSLRLLQS